MKVLIADDEEHVREAIELSVDWEKFGIGERLMAEDGIQALELVRRHNPAVLFCDMKMPKMDGTELLRSLREENDETQVIVISGYDDFQYTRAAIRAWGVDYLLKPFRKRDLEQALERALAEWRNNETSKKENRETVFRMKQADDLLDERRLAAYLKGEIPFHEGIRGFLNNLGDPAQEIWAALVLPRNQIEIVNGRFGGDAELFMFAINNIVQEIFGANGSYHFCRLDPYQWVILIADNERKVQPADVRAYIRKLSDAWFRTFGLLTFVGLSKEQAAMDKLPTAVGDARISLLKSKVLDSGNAPETEAVKLRLTDKQVLLEAALNAGNKVYAAEIIGSFVRAIVARGILSLKELQAYTMEANLLLERASRLISPSNEMPELSLPLWISDLEEWEKLLRGQWWRLIEESGNEGSGNHAIESIREYMNRNYQEEISLSTLSEMFHFSPQYIAKKFKEIYNTTVVTYLTELRIEKARSLLAHTGMAVLEISETVGYSDENYFGKVFKKHTGLSPLQYRKQEQQKGTSR